MEWRQTDPRGELNKRAAIVVIRPHPVIDGRWQAGIGEVGPKEARNIRLFGLNDSRRIAAEESWPSGWRWLWAPSASWGGQL